MDKRLTLPTLIIAALALAAPADAARKPTRSERIELLQAAGGARSKCVVVRVATVRPGWGSVAVRTRPRRSCWDEVGNGIMFYRHRAGGWRTRTGMSDCPRNVRGVPLRVYRDLSRRYCHGRWRQGA